MLKNEANGVSQSKISDIKMKGGHSKHQYEEISASASWRLIKPLRMSLAFIKQRLHLTLLSKGIKKLRKNGLRATAMKVREYLCFSKNIKEIGGRLKYSESNLNNQRNYKFNKNITFSIITPLYNTPCKFLCEMIDSVISQTYPNWELCLADGSDDGHSYVGEICRNYSRQDKRIKYLKLKSNKGISENSNAAAKIAAGEYLAILDHDDILSPAALFENMKIIDISDHSPAFLYSDEVTFANETTNVRGAHFKPDYAIDNLRANNYICHFAVFTRVLWDQSGGFHAEYDGSQDHDLFLRFTELTSDITHISKVLYFWRAHAGSVAGNIDAKSYASEAGIKAVESHLKRCGIKGRVERADICPNMYRIRYTIINEPLISIIIPSFNHLQDIAKCINSIVEQTTYGNYEILIIANSSTKMLFPNDYKSFSQNKKVSILTWRHHLNYSQINNFAATQAKGEYLLFLNNATQAINKEWLEEMLMYAQRDDVGCVGAKLYYSNDTIQHAGIILGLCGLTGNSHCGVSKCSAGYMGRLGYAQDVTAVTAACMMISKEKFLTVGGFNEDFEAAYNDIDLCMKIRHAGYLNIFTPFAELYHFESKTRGYHNTSQNEQGFKKATELFQRIWAKELAAGDPYYNKNLTLSKHDFSIDWERL